MSEFKSELNIVGLPAFDSNYLWVIHNGFNAWAVDPGDADVVSQYLQAQHLSLSGILITHHHADHVGGVLTLKQQFPSLTVIGPMVETIAGLDVNATDNTHFELTGLGSVAQPAHVQCMTVPGHTLGHVAYFLPPCPALANRPRLFCGDTLFAGGCGRLFEGTPAQMLASLQRLMQLPSPTLAYCAHEYTASNLAFAAAVEPNNTAIVVRINSVRQQRALGISSIPFELGLEPATNVFLRSNQPDVQASVSSQAGIHLHEPVDVFTQLRLWKNSF